MSRRHRARIQGRLRILVLSGLITFLIAEIAWIELARRRPVPSGVTAAIAVPPLPAPEPLARYAEIVTGDLFSETRQPSERVLARVAVPAASQTGALRVLAIVVSDSDRLALVEITGSAELVRLRQGDRAGPYRVLAIGPDSITLENNGLTEIFAVPSQEAPAQGLPPGTAQGAAPPNAPALAATPPMAGGPSAAEAQEFNRHFLEMRAMEKPDPTLVPSSPQTSARPKS